MRDSLMSTCALLGAALLAACGPPAEQHPCNLTGNSGCNDGHVCEAVMGDQPTCFAPVLVKGSVADLATSAPLGGASVVGLDSNKAPASTVDVSASDGTYQLELEHVTRGDSTGKPVQATITLRADMQGYQSFPSGVRTALPIDLSTATNTSGDWVVSGPLTVVKLAQLTGGGAAFIHGSVAAAPSGAGGLVVAEPAPGGGGPQTGFTGVADTSGNYEIDNLSPGTQYVVTAYTQGANYTPVTTAALVAGDNAVSQLVLASGTGATLAGGFIFNNGASSNIDATLVVASTYVPNLDRGETPPGLTVAGSASGYSFTGVPDGSYVVLAPFGLTGDVRDISGGGNTAAPLVKIASGAVVGSPPSFKIIPAVDLLTIGGTAVSATPVTVTTATPTFAWQKSNVDSNANTYRVIVYDTFGNQTWSTDVAASTTDSIAYGGTPLQAGMSYLLRILAIKDSMPVPTSFTQMSETEDVPGVFTFAP
jgi:hypothetical protein